MENSGRDYNSDTVKRACNIIKEYGFTLGVQLMIGLPGDSKDLSIKTAKEAVTLNPDMVRLYPTIVIANTTLDEMFKEKNTIH